MPVDFESLPVAQMLCFEIKLSFIEDLLLGVCVVFEKALWCTLCTDPWSVIGRLEDLPK